MKLDLTDSQIDRLIRAVDVIREDPAWAPAMRAASAGRGKAANRLLLDTAAHIGFEEGLEALLERKP